MAQFEYKYKEHRYTPSGAKSLSEAELRAEYSRMRAVANKRIERLQQSEFKEHKLAREYHEGFAKISDLMGRSELEEQFTEVAWFLRQQKSTISGEKSIRKRAIATLHKEGVKFVDVENYEDFVQFWEYVTSKYKALEYDSEKVRKWYEDTVTANEITVDTLHKEFDKWIAVQDYAPAKSK